MKITKKFADKFKYQFRKTKKNRLLACLERFPKGGLDHWPEKVEKKDYDPMKSELAAWLVAQPEIRNYITSRLRHLGLIVFNQEKGKWITIPELDIRFKELWFRGRDIGRPFIYKPKAILDCPMLNSAGGVNVTEWFRWIRLQMPVSGLTFFKYVRKAEELGYVVKIQKQKNIWKSTGHVPVNNKTEERLKKSGRPIKYDSQPLIEVLKAGEISSKAFCKRVNEETGMSRAMFYRVLSKLKDEGRVVRRDISGYWSIAPAAAPKIQSASEALAALLT